VDRAAVLAAYDEQVRRRAPPAGPGERVEHDEGVIRCVGDWWTGVLWASLDASSADRVIAAQVARFADRAQPWEWKHYSHDQPADLPDRLLAAGFTPEPPEAVLVGEIAELALKVEAPPGVVLRPVAGEADLEALVAVHERVFGGDHSAVGEVLLAGLARRPCTAGAVVAFAGDEPIAAGRIEFHPESEFASFWGDGTVRAWRGRGVFRAIVAHRASLAAERGLRYLWVEATDDSAPILRRLGFVQVATTTPYVHPGARR
jgi:hypothetical protein